MRNPFKSRRREYPRAEPKGDQAECGHAVEDNAPLEQEARLELDLAFDEAASKVAGVVGSSGITQDDLLLLYGLYKQATCGPCTSFRPPFFDLQARSKW